MRIAFTGSHGTGKSSVARRLIDYPKLFHYKLVDGASRSCKDSGYTINQDADRLSQLMILIRQIDLEKNAHRNYISARSSLDPLAYAEELTKRKGWDDFYIEQYRMLAYSHFYTTYDALFYFPITFKLEYDGVRPMDEEYQYKIDYTIQRGLDKIGHFVVPAGSVDERAEYIKNVIARLERRASMVTVPGWTPPVQKGTE